MNLKKSDKIIVAAAIAVLIVAAIGIIFYTYSEEEEITPPATGGKKYEVTWVKDEGSISSITEFVKFKETYDKPFTVTVNTPPGSVITDVHVHITWQDDYTKGLLFNKGEDTLTAIITAPGGESKTHTAKGEGNETLDFHINSEPVDEIIENVNDSIEAEQKVQEEYQGENTATFGVNVTVEKGEKLSLRPLKLLNYFRDKGNDFTFEITFDYYYPSIVESENPGDNGTTLDLPQDNTGTQTWYAMGFPGKN